MEAGEAVGCQAYLLHPKRVLVEAGPHGTGALELAEHPHVFIPRIGSTIEDSELAAVYHLERSGIPAINGFEALVVARDKFLSLRKLSEVGIPVPRTFLVSESAQLRHAIQALGGFPLVMKTARGRQGTDVYLVEDMVFADYLLRHPPRMSEGILVQQFIPSGSRGDVRVVIAAGRVIASMRRVPKKGDFRTNAHQRGKGLAWSPQPVWVRLALDASEALRLEVSGVDLVEGPDGPLVLEVNTTPGFRELERVTGIDVAREIIIYAVEVAKRR